MYRRGRGTPGTDSKIVDSTNRKWIFDAVGEQTLQFQQYPLCDRKVGVGTEIIQRHGLAGSV